MSTASTYFCDPQFRTEYLERLAIQRPPEIGNQVWSDVHEEVQGVLGALDERVQLRVSHLHVESGRTQGRNFCLFTYRTFSRTDATEIDPVVVGLTFTRADDDRTGQIVIDADISGESTGDGIETLAPRTASAFREELLRAARELARDISCYGPRIAEALLDSSRRT